MIHEVTVNIAVTRLFFDTLPLTFSLLLASLNILVNLPLEGI